MAERNNNETKTEKPYERGQLVDRVDQSNGGVRIIFPPDGVWQARNRPGSTSSPPKFSMPKEAEDKVLTDYTPARIKHRIDGSTKSESKSRPRNRWFGDGVAFQ